MSEAVQHKVDKTNIRSLVHPRLFFTGLNLHFKDQEHGHYRRYYNLYHRQ